MKTKIFSKLIAGAVTLAMAAQCAFVLPIGASAEIIRTDYLNQPFDSYTAPAKAEVIEDPADSTNKILKVSSGASVTVDGFPSTTEASFSMEMDVNFPVALTTGTTTKKADGAIFAFGATTGTVMKVHGPTTADNKVPFGYSFGGGSGQYGKVGDLDMNKWYTVVVNFTDADNSDNGKIGFTVYDRDAYKADKTAATPICTKTDMGLRNGALPNALIIGLTGDVSGEYFYVDNIKTFKEVDTEAVNELKAISFKTTPGTIITPPAGDKEEKTYPIELDLDGTTGALTAEECDSIVWEHIGAEANEDGYFKWNFENNKAAGSISITNGIGTYFCILKATVTKGDNTKTAEYKFMINSAGAGNANQLYPKAGYPVNLNEYEDALVGYNVGSGQGMNDQDPILSGWTMYGSNTGRNMYLRQDETTKDKYLEITNSGTASGSIMAKYVFEAQSSQIVTDMNIKFVNGTAIGYYDGSGKGSGLPNNGGAAAAAVSYSNGSLMAGEQKIESLDTDSWYRLIISQDASVGEYWAAVYDADTGELKGKTEPVAMNQKVNATCICINGGFPTLIKDMKIYKPTVKSLKINGDATVKIPEKTYAVTGTLGTGVASVTLKNEKDETMNGTVEGTSVVFDVLEGTYTVAPVAAKGYHDASATPQTVTVDQGHETASFTTEAVKDAVTETTITTSGKIATVSYVGDNIADAVLIRASYNEGALDGVEIKPAALENGKDTPVEFTALNENDVLMLWDGIDSMKPLTGAYTVTTLEKQISELAEEPAAASDAKVNTLALTATVTSAEDENVPISGEVAWSLGDEYADVTIEKTGAQAATLKVGQNAPAGEIEVKAVCGAGTDAKKIMLTSSADSVAFTKSKSSITIPFEGEEAQTAEFAAETRDKDGNPKAGTITYDVLDKTGTAPLTTMPTGISFDTTTGVLTVASGATPSIIYIRATNGDGLSSKVKVNVHGLSFGFGSGEQEGLTQVTDTAYTESLGYGFSNASAITVAENNVTSAEAYQFNAKVPNGNYTVNVTTTSDSIFSEMVDNLAYTTKTGASFDVAVCDGVLDLTFAANSTVSQITIRQAAPKKVGEKPALYSIGDSTTNNHGHYSGYADDKKAQELDPTKWVDEREYASWGNCVTEAMYSEAFASYTNHGMAGRDSLNYYNQNRLEAVLLAIAPGDYVTVNMGINAKTAGEGGMYEKLMENYYVQGIIQRGAIPVILTHTPQNPVGAYAGNYDAATSKFNCNRPDDGRVKFLKNLATKYDLSLIDMTTWGNDYFNTLTTDDLSKANTANSVNHGYKAPTTVLELVQSWCPDHNHYTSELGTTYAEYIMSELTKIVKAASEKPAE